MIGEGLNCLAMTGGTIAVRFAVPTLVIVVPLSLVESVPLTLPCGPAVVAMTLTLTVQEPLAGIVPPLNVSDVAAAVGAHVPPHVVAAAGVAATCTPAGSASVNAALVSGAGFAFVSVNVSVEIPFTAIGLGENALAIAGFTAAPQPVKTTLSIDRSAPGLVFPELKPYTRKNVSPDGFKPLLTVIGPNAVQAVPAAVSAAE